MESIYIKDLKNYVGKPVKICGWLYNKRSSGKIHFLLIRDGTGIVQGVMAKDNVSNEIFEASDNISQESSVVIEGSLREDERAPSGYELDITDVKIIQMAEKYPISKQAHGVDFLMSHRHLWLRSKKQYAIMRIRNEILMAIRKFFYDRDFILIDTPILTPAACEGTTTLFEVKYFDDIAYLAQSGQLYLEAACMAHNKVYCLGPTFRAEKSKTRKHLTEFWMAEAEVAYADLEKIMKLAEEFVFYIVQWVLKNCKKELEVLERDIKPLEKITLPFPRVTYTEAIDIIKKSGEEFEWGGDFGAPQEEIISKSFQYPVLVHRYPADAKAFYMKADPEDEKISLCVDMIAPEGTGEIIGGSERATDIEFLEEKIKKYNLPKEAFKWYLDLRRFGSVPHSGFGLGIERTIAWIAGIRHIREVIPFPRMLYRIYP